LWIGCHSDEEITTSKVAIDGQGILGVLLHVACAARKGRGKDKALAQLIEVHISICCHSILQALIDLHTKLLLIISMVSEAALFRNSPSLTDILLKELASKKEMIGLNVWRARKEMEAMELSQRHVFTLVFPLLIF
jgi:hypothetical protein